MSNTKSFAKRFVASFVCLLVLAGAVPSLGALQVQAATIELTDEFYAAYMGATDVADTSLPATVDSKPVTWNLSALTYANAYEAVTVTGTDGSDDYTATVEVLPPQENQMVYFVDAGRYGGTNAATVPSGSSQSSYPAHYAQSPTYNAIQAFTGDALKNDMPDNSFDHDHGLGGPLEDRTWGHVLTNGSNYKRTIVGGDPGNTSALEVKNKNLLGARTNLSAIEYKFTLDAGTYTLTSGFTEFYPGQSRTRTMMPTLIYTMDGETHAVELGIITTSTSSAETFVHPRVFTLPEGADELVTISYKNAGGEAPHIAWVGICEGEYEEIVAPQFVHLDGDDIDTTNRNGLTFKGFGILSGNSTSDLLLDYKSQNPEAYAELMQILFGGDNPVMTHVKLEMGNDRNNSTGPETSTMRTADEDANVLRNPGWQIAADAKKINPDVVVSVLYWNTPAWADRYSEDMYTWYRDSIIDAYNEYGFVVDYVNPNVNEHWGGSTDIANAKNFAAWRDAQETQANGGVFPDDTSLALFKEIKLVVSDEVSTVSTGVATALFNDQDFQNAVDVVGYHYSPHDDANGGMKRAATELDMEIWNSEAQATFSNSSFRPSNNTADPTVEGTGMGGVGSSLEMANTFVKGFVESYRTHVIYQPAIGSFYEGGQYSFKELISARDPWSGWIHYDGGLVILQHVSHFAVTGWENETNTAGIWRGVPQASGSNANGTNPVNGRNGGGNFMTLAAPTKDDFSTLVVNDSEYEIPYQLSYSNMNLPAGQTLAVWETRAADDGEGFNTNYKQLVDTLVPDGSGNYHFTMKPYSIVTLTTLDQSGNEEVTKPLPVEGERTVLDTDGTGEVQDTSDNYLYADNFDYTGKTVPVLDGNGGFTGGTEGYIASRGGDTGAQPRYTQNLNGALEVYQSGDAGHGYVLRQQVDPVGTGIGGAWNGGDAGTALGDFRWTNYKASVDVLFENEIDNPYAVIGARQYGASNNAMATSAYMMQIEPNGNWALQRFGSTVTSGNAVADASFVTGANQWNNIAIEVAENTITVFVNDVEVGRYVDSLPQLAGRILLGGSYNFMQFDNLEVTKVDGYEPYYSEFLDNLETYDLTPQRNDKLVYNEKWNHVLGQGMYVYQRTLSNSKGAGATLSYTFEGTGLDILGENSGSAVLKVTVDGEVISDKMATQASGLMRNTYSLRGLPYGTHTVEIELVSGSLSVDAVGAVGGYISGDIDSAWLLDAIQDVAGTEKLPEYSEEAWALFQTNLSMAQQVAADAGLCGLDQAGIYQLATRLDYAYGALTGKGIVSIEPAYTAVFAGGEVELPSQVLATFQDGSTDYVDVVWEDVSGIDFSTPYETLAVSGVARRKTVIDYVEVVPDGTIYFVDIGAAADLPRTDGWDYDSPAYLAVADLAESVGYPLLNSKPDQPYNAGGGYGSGSGSGGVIYKGTSGSVYSKYTTTGIYTSNTIGQYLTYTFDLEAGTYDIGLGLHDWWPTYGRTAVITATDSAGVTTTLADTWAYDSAPSLLASSFTVTQDGPVEVRLTSKSVAQSPMLNWIMISEDTLRNPQFTAPDKDEYELYEEFNAEGMQFTVDRGGVELDLTDYLTISSTPEFDNETPGDYVFTVSYRDFTEDFTVTVLAPTVRSIEITSLPNQTVYALGEGFTESGLVVTGILNDGSTQDVTGSMYVNGAFDGNTPGTYTMTVNYINSRGETLTTTFDVVVLDADDPVPVDIELTAPGKTEYAYGEDLDRTGMAVSLVYDDDSREDVTGVATVSGYNAYTEGSQTITVSYLGFTATFDVYVHSRITLESIELGGTAQTVFAYGEVFNHTGLVVTAHYSDGNSNDVSANVIVDATAYDASTPGDYTIYVRFGGEEASYTVTVQAAPVTLTGLELASPPTKTTYEQGQPFESRGMKVNAVYSDGTKVDVTSSVTVNGFDSSNLGTITLTVTYQGRFTTFDVTIVEATDPGPGPIDPGEDKGINVMGGNSGSRKDGSSSSFTITTDGEYDKFVGVKVDGVELTRDTHYTVAEGSTIVTLLPSFLNTLSVGDHIVEIVFQNGTATYTLTINRDGSTSGGSSANAITATGDSAVQWPWIVAIVLGAMALAAVVLIKRRKAIKG